MTIKKKTVIPAKKDTVDIGQLDVFFDLQNKELELKREEMGLRRLEIEYASKSATLSVAAEKDVQVLQQQHSVIVHTNRKVIIIAGMVLFTALAGAALLLDKESTLVELVKLAAVAVGSGLGGFAYGKSKPNANPDES